MADKKPPAAGAPNLTLVGGALDNAKPAPKVGKRPAPGSEIEEPELPMLPPGCPVEPLGKLGQLCFYLDEQRQLIGLKPNEHAKQHIRNLFGRKSHLCDEFWPRFSDKEGLDGAKLITGWKPEIAADLLMRACAFRGIFDPQGKVRGSGAHRSDDGELMLHCGDTIFITGVHSGYVDPGLISGYVYPAGAARPRPDPVEQTSAPGELVIAKLRAWQWFRPLVDPMLLLGWIGCAMVGGALNWRPHAWITGGTGTGKSTLQNLLRTIFDGGALTTGDATEASLRQLLKQQTLPVFFDELEPDSQGDNRKNSGVIKLARLASSGEQALRGGQDHVGHEFTIRSCFLFSSILTPPMQAQDKNRLAILELHRIEAGKSAPQIDLAELRTLGRQLRRRLVDHWHRLDRLTERYKTALANVGHNGRSGDQFGTLLAVADLLLYDEPDEAAILEWANKLRADTLAEKEADLADEEAVVQFISTSFLPQRGGDDPEPLVRILERAIGTDPAKARERLENFGLRIVERTPSGGRDPQAATPIRDLYLAIANSHRALERVFAETEWADGTWQQSFGRVDGAKRRVKIRFGPGKPAWATLIPLPAILDFKAEAP